MNQNEINMHEVCKKFNNYENKDFKGDLLFKAYEDYKYEEDLLSSYIAAKEKFDCLYGFFLTNTRIIEINAYSTMYTVTIKKYKAIKKIVLEKEFDNNKINNVLSEKIDAERLQLRVTYVDINGQEEEYNWEHMESEDNINQADVFAKRLFEHQYKMQ